MFKFVQTILYVYHYGSTLCYGTLNIIVAYKYNSKYIKLLYIHWMNNLQRYETYNYEKPTKFNFYIGYTHDKIFT